MNKDSLFESLFRIFIDKNPCLIQSSSIKNSDIYCLANDYTFLNKMLPKDIQYFIDLKSELSNKKICTNMIDIYCLVFSECININNNKTQKEMICSLLKKYLGNIIEEINKELLKNLEDKNANDVNNHTKSQKHNYNKKNLKITIKFLFLILVFMFNKYKNIIEGTFIGCVNKGINLKNLKSNKIREELFYLKIIEENLYWINMINTGLFTIFQNLKNNKFRYLINADTEFNELDEDFKDYCFTCFLDLFDIVKKYSSIKLSNKATNLFFNVINIFSIDKSISILFECFVYEFLYNIDSVWKYYDKINGGENVINENYGILIGFGIYLSQFIQTVTFYRNEKISKIDFFNFYYFSYKLMTNYFSKLNIYLYRVFNNISNIKKRNYIIANPEINPNYLQYLSNSLKNLLFNFMISSNNNDTLKDIYSFNEILINSLVSHCFMKTILSICSRIRNNLHSNLIPEILMILLDNINKYKIILPLKCHFHKELMTHNFLLILDEFLNNNENELILYFNSIQFQCSNIIINNLLNKFKETLSCMFNHYNQLNFLYSNHIMFKFNQILSSAGILTPKLNFRIENIFLRHIISEKNTLDYQDIPISRINITEKYNPNFSVNLLPNNNSDYNDINFDNVTYNKELTFNIDNVGFAMDEYLDKNITELFNNESFEEYELNIVGNKSYLVKNSMGKNYSIIFTKGDKFIEKLGIDEKLKENILNIMENVQYTDKIVYKLIQEKVINPGNANINVNAYFYNNIKYYDLKFQMNFFQYQEKIKELLL